MDAMDIDVPDDFELPSPPPPVVPKEMKDEEVKVETREARRDERLLTARRIDIDHPQAAVKAAFDKQGFDLDNKDRVFLRSVKKGGGGDLDVEDWILMYDALRLGSDGLNAREVVMEEEWVRISCHALSLWAARCDPMGWKRPVLLKQVLEALDSLVPVLVPQTSTPPSSPSKMKRVPVSPKGSPRKSPNKAQKRTFIDLCGDDNEDVKVGKQRVE